MVPFLNPRLSSSVGVCAQASLTISLFIRLASCSKLNALRWYDVVQLGRCGLKAFRFHSVRCVAPH
jgi:hypothetical protein